MTTSDPTRARLVFVVGNSRSGTTMVARMLDLHSAIHTLREVHFVEELWLPADRGRELDRDAAVTLAGTLIQRAQVRYQHGTPDAGHRAQAEQIVAGLAGPRTGEAVFAATLNAEAARHGKAIACEQTPRNVYFVRDLLTVFPNALVVSVIRDPRDVLASQKNWWHKAEQDGERIARLVRVRHWANYHPWLTSLLWRGGARAQLAVADHPRVISLRYEDVLVDGKGALGTITDALDLPFEAEMLDVRRAGSSTRDDEEVTGPDPSRTGNWHTHLRPSEVWLAQRVGAAEYAAFGYAAAPMRTPYLGVAASMAVLPGKLALAFVLNVRRSRDLLASIKRRYFSLSDGSA